MPRMMAPNTTWILIRHEPEALSKKKLQRTRECSAGKLRLRVTNRIIAFRVSRLKRDVAMQRGRVEARVLDTLIEEGLRLGMIFICKGRLKE
jgi:hypothetical protein